MQKDHQLLHAVHGISVQPLHSQGSSEPASREEGALSAWEISAPVWVVCQAFDDEAAATGGIRLVHHLRISWLSTLS